MNSNRKDIKKIDIDKLDIKAGLNASLDKEGISVSEDLVRRTLEAIRMNETSGRESGVNMTERKKPVFSYGYVRTFVAAAAAVLVLVAGMNAIRIFTPKTFKSDLAKQELDGAAGGSNMAEKQDTLYDDSMLDENRMDMLQSAEMPVQDTARGYEEKAADEGSGMDGGLSVDASAPQDGNENNKLRMVREVYGFSDIVQMESGKISEITISYGDADIIDVISDRGLIDDFYAMMQNYSFKFGAANDTVIHYVIKLKSEDGDAQLLIGDASVTVDCTRGDIASHSIYTSDDQASIVRGIEDFLAGRGNN